MCKSYAISEINMHKCYLPNLWWTLNTKRHEMLLPPPIDDYLFRQALVLERIKYCILNGSKISSSWSVHRNFIVAQIGRNCRCTVSRKSKSICAKQNKMTNTAIVILEHWKENWLLKIAITLEGIAEHLGGLPRRVCSPWRDQPVSWSNNLI